MWQGSVGMDTYVVGLDRSESARDALAWARAEAGADDQIVAVHAQPLPAGLGYDTMGGIPVVPIEDARDVFLDRALEDIGDLRLSGRTVTGHAGTAIVEIAKELGPDVTVVVGHGRSSKASLVVGSIAHYVIHHAETPVVVVRGRATAPAKRLVVGVDRGDADTDPDERSLAALRWAVRLPGVEHIEVSHADFVPGVAAGPVREPGIESPEAVDHDTALLRRAVDLATDGTGVPPNGAAIVPVVAAGSGAFALIEASREADLVVIGTRGRSALVELLAGSTGLDVLAHSHCPVAVIR